MHARVEEEENTNCIRLNTLAGLHLESITCIVQPYSVHIYNSSNLLNIINGLE